MLSRLILVLSTLFLLSGCFTAVKHAYDGPKLPPEKLAGIDIGTYNLRIREINGEFVGGNTVYIKPGISTVSFKATKSDGITKYTNSWTVKFNAEMDHTYVFMTDPAPKKHHYYLRGIDMGTTYKIDRKRPYEDIWAEVKRVGKPMKFLKK